MLQQLNSRIQGWFAWVIILLIAATFALFGVERYIQSRGENVVKVEINGDPVSVRDFELSFKRNQRLQQSSSSSSAQEQSQKQALLDGLILRKIALQSALSNGFYVTNDETLTAIQQIPEFQQEGHFSMGRYQQAISNALFTPTSFQTEVSEGLLLNQQRFAFSGTAFALPDELAQFVKLYDQTRDYDYVLIPYQPLMAQVKMDDNVLTAYYEKHHSAFSTPEQVVVDYVRLSMPEIRAKIKLSDTDIKQYYDDNQNNFLTPAQWHVAHLFFAIPKGATPAQQSQVASKATQAFQVLQKSPQQFSAMVKAQSDDKVSAIDSGVLPWIVAGQSGWDKALVALTTVGQISAPFKTDQGYEIFKLMAYKPATIKPLNVVKDEIQNQLLMDKVQSAYSRVSEQLSDLAYQTPDSLVTVSETLHLPIQQTTPFSREGGGEALTKNPQVLQTAFSQEILSQGNNSEPLQVDNDTLIVLRLAKHIPAAEKPFSAVKEEIKALLVKKQAQKSAQTLGQMFLRLNPQQQTTWLDTHHLKWQNAQKMPRKTKTVPEDINQRAFQMERPGSLVGDVLGKGDFVVIRLTKVHDGSIRTLSQEEAANLLQQIEVSHGTQDFDSVMQSLLKSAKVNRY